MGRRRGHGTGDRPSGRRAGIRRDVLATSINQASTCLPLPCHEGPGREPGVRHSGKPATGTNGRPSTGTAGRGRQAPSGGDHKPANPPLHEAREGTGRFSSRGNGGRIAPANPTAPPGIARHPASTREPPLDTLPALRQAGERTHRDESMGEVGTARIDGSRAGGGPSSSRTGGI